MCERYVLPDQITVEREFLPARAWWSFTINFNVATQQYVPAIRCHDAQSEAVMMRWGLIPSWAQGKWIGVPPERDKRFLIVDRDAKYSATFRQTLEREGIGVIRLPPRSPNLNAYAERFVRLVKEECLSKIIPIGPGMLARSLREYFNLSSRTQSPGHRQSAHHADVHPPSPRAGYCSPAATWRNPELLSTRRGVAHGVFEQNAP